MSADVLAMSATIDQPGKYQIKLSIFFYFQNNLVLTGKDKEVNRNDTSLFRIKVSVPWLSTNFF